MCNKKLKEKIIQYFQDKNGVIAVYVFGSYAEDKERHLSDIDIGILMDRISQDNIGKNRSVYMIEMSRILKKDVHPVMLNSAGEVLLKQIFKKGKCVLVNNAKALSRKKMVMFSDIADFTYYQGKMQLGLIRKVMRG